MSFALKQHEFVFNVFCPFIGIGVGALGMQDVRATVGSANAKFQVVGGIDADAGAVANACRLLGAPISVMDLFTREQYEDFHGKPPPHGWREVTPEDVRFAAGGHSVNVVMLSPPCKGFTTLITNAISESKRYRAMNALALRGVWLCLEAFKDDLPEFFLFECVPSILNRGRRFLDQVSGLFSAYGFAAAETVHDCGPLGGLAQHRRRFLGVARNTAKVPNFLYQPRALPMKSLADVIGRLPPPSPLVHPLHGVSNLEWKTWSRLAMVEAGSDWKSVDRLRQANGVLADFALSRRGSIADGLAPIADPRFNSGGNDYSQYGVMNWNASSGAIIAIRSPGQGVFSVADPRIDQCRLNPTLEFDVVQRPPSQAPSFELPGPCDRITCVITAPDGTWHRPLTTLEAAALQAIFEPEHLDAFRLEAQSQAQCKEWIGNAIPRTAARGMGEAIAKALLMARTEQTQVITDEPIWVRSAIAALQCSAVH